MLAQRSSRLTATSDLRLLERLAGSDEDAFQEIWGRYHQRLTAFASRYVQSHDAAVDVVQDAFIALWDRRKQMLLPGTLNSYLYSMVRHTALDVQKQSRIVRQHAEFATSTYTSAPAIANTLGVEAVEVELLQGLVQRVIAELPPKTREIFLMSREDKLTPGTIATVLNITPQVVYNQLARAVRALHVALADTER